ncbi:MAG: GatB/YqeY domain-containing protein [Clostridia bacterium]
MKEELLKELKNAMKEKDELRKNTITMLRAAILQVEKDTQKILSEEDMICIVAKEVKKRRESIEDYKKADRLDIVKDLEREIEILEKYLPEQLDISQITDMVEEAINIVGAISIKQMGAVMQQLRQKTAGRADGKILSDIVKQKLS